MSLLPPALAGGFFITNATWEAPEVKQNHKTFIKKKSEKIFRVQAKAKGS